MDTTKQAIKDFIKARLADNNATLDQIKDEFKKNNNFGAISAIDNAFIERKYIKYCSQLFLDEVKDTLFEDYDEEKEIINVVKEVFMLINTIKDINEVSSYNMTYHKLLMGIEDKLSDAIKTNLVEQFKKTCLELIVKYSDSIEREIKFLYSLIDVLDSSIELASVLQIESFCNEDIDLDTLLKNILNLDGCQELKELTQELLDQDHDEFFLFDSFKEALFPFYKPVEIKTEIIDGRTVLEVSSIHINLKTVIDKIEDFLRANADIEEVRIVGADTLLVNCDFKRGINVVVYVKHVDVQGEVTWDISGKSSDHVYKENAGTDDNGHGKAGSDGFSGESGGEALILCDTIKNASNWTIISNGGDGSRGQDGGDGKDGADGEGITKKQMLDWFPSFVDNSSTFFANFYVGENLDTTRKNIRSFAENVEVDWLAPRGHVYIKATTRDKCKITFSFCRHELWTTYLQGFILYEGAPGKAGGNGGEGGFGGHGGYSGKVEVSHDKIKVVSKPGENGENGSGGEFGHQGKSGWDIAYTNHQSFNRPLFYGTNHDRKLMIKQFDSYDNERVWSPYDNKYVDIYTKKVDETSEKSYKVRAKVSGQRKIQTQAEATRKKAITKSSIIKQYSNLFVSRQNAGLEALKHSLQNTKRDASNAMWRDACAKRVAQETQIQRHMRHPANTKKTRSKTSKCKLETIPEEIFADLAKTLKKNRHNRDLWFNLNKIELTRSEINDLFKVLPRDFTEIDRFLVEKYAFAALNEMCLNINATSTKSVLKLTADEAARFLLESSANSQILEVLNQSTSGAKLKDLKNKHLNQAIGVFVGQKGTLKEAESYFNAHQEFLENKKKSLAMILEVILKGLSDYPFVTKKYLETRVMGDEFLQPLYNHYNKKLKQEFDWDEASKDSALVKAFESCIKKDGSKSAAYRELIAHDLNINLRLYKETKNGFVLLNNHNSDSLESVYCLLKDNRFTCLELNKNHLEMHLERVELSEIYEEILGFALNLETRGEIDDFVKSACFGRSVDKNQRTIHGNEDDFINAILLHFSFDDWKDLAVRLEAIGVKFTGQSEILKILSKKFACDGRHVDISILYYIVDFIISLACSGRDEFNLVAWIIGAFAQKHWLDEILLIQIEDHFKKKLKKSDLRRYLRQIEDKRYLITLGVEFSQCPLSFEQLSDVLYLMSSIPPSDFVVIDNLNLSEWPYALKDKYWSHKLTLIEPHWTSESLEIISFYLMALENSVGVKLVERLVDLLLRKKISLKSTESKQCFIEILTRFYRDEIKLSDAILDVFSRKSKIKEWSKKIETITSANLDRDRNFLELVSEIIENGNTSLGVSEKLKTLSSSPFGDNFKNAPLAEIGDWLSRHATTCAHHDIIAVITRVVEIKKKITLRDTQKLTILLSVENKRNLLAQVSTGEGKSLIVVALAIIKAINGNKVDIVTNSSVLAKRDAESYKEIYNVFGIRVSHNCTEDIEERKKSYSDCQVVYGDLSSFQRDYLLDRFYGKNILGNRRFNSVIVDEVDSMLLDKGNNMLYLSQDIVGLDKLESLYVFIWYKVNRPIKDFDDLKTILDVNAIKESIYYDLYGAFNKNDLKLLDEDLTWEHLIESKIIDGRGRLLITDTNNIKVSDQLKFFLDHHLARSRHIKIPNYLSDFVDQHLDDWIKSAITAFLMKERTDYVVDVDRSSSSPDRNPQIIILDRDTGTDQANSQWEEALHQFLQLKHGCRLSLQSLKSVFISNVSYFKLYDKLYGLTGTLGSRRERDLLKDIHDVDFVTIPTSKPKKFIEVAPVLCLDQDEWLESIAGDTFKACDRGRCVLIIAETVDRVEKITKKLTNNSGKYQIQTYTRDYEDFSDEELPQNHIIVATNLAGRGTDIKITRDVNKNGGLHVVVSYLPDNSRIEQQAFGRSARNGEYGSGQLIIESGSRGMAKIIKLKRERDLEELERISKIKEHYDLQISKEEAFLKDFQACYKKISDLFDKFEVDADIRDIFLKTCLEKWAFWLDSASRALKTKSGHALDKSFEKLIENMRDVAETNYDFTDYRVVEKVVDFTMKQRKNNAALASIVAKFQNKIIDNPFSLLKLAKFFIGAKKLSEASSILAQIIKNEPAFCDAAHYYRASVYLKQGSVKSAKNELKKCSKLIDRHVSFIRNAYAIVSSLKKNDASSKIQIDAYEAQKKNEEEVYNVFKHSIDNILGHAVSLQHFINESCDFKDANSLYDALLKKGVLTRPRIARKTPDLAGICAESCVNHDDVVQFLKKSRSERFDEEVFQKRFKECVDLPNREDFWLILVENGILTNETVFVTVDKDKLMQVLPNFELPSESLCLDKNRMILYPEQITSVFDESAFKSKTRDFDLLTKNDVVSLNRSGEIDCEKLKSLKLTRFDSLKIADFDSVKIPEKFATKILEDLAKNKIIESSGSEFKLIADSTAIREFCLSKHRLYENATKKLLLHRFAYRIALQQLQAQDAPRQIHLVSNPHAQLILRLTEESAIKPTKVDKNLTISEKSVGSKDVAATLNQLKTSLKSVDVPDCHFRSLQDYFGERSLEDTHNFLLDGFDKVITVTEAKYTKWMWMKTACVVFLGIAQMAIGVALTYFSAGLLAYAGQAFISEGFGDLMFAMSCARSGNFSWKDYGRHKIVSLCITTVSFGVGACFVKSAKIAHAAATPKAIAATVAKEVGLKILQGVAFGTASIGIDIVIENYLKKLALNISKTLTSDIDKSIDSNQDFHEATLRAYKILGADKAKSMISKLYNDYFAPEEFKKQLIPLCARAVSSIILQIIAVRSNVDNKSAMSVYAKITELIARVSISTLQIMKLKSMVDNIAKDMAVKINKKLDAKKGVPNKTFDILVCESYQTQVKDELKKLVEENATRVITDHVLNPIMQTGSSALLKYLGKVVTNKYNSYCDKSYMKEFEQEKENYNRELEENQNRPSEEFEKIKDKLTQEYHEKIIALKDKIHSDELKNVLLKEIKSLVLIKDQDKLLNQVTKREMNYLKELIDLNTDNASLQDCKDIVENLENAQLKEHLRKILNGENSQYNGPKISAEDRNRILNMGESLTSQLDSASSLEFQKLQRVHNKILKINQDAINSLNNNTLTDNQWLSEYILTKKFLEDNSSENYQETKRLNTVASAVNDGVLYLACNYQVNDVNANETYGWTEDDKISITRDLKHLQSLMKFSKIVFVEPKDAIETRYDNRAPHAEMQLMSYFKKNNIKIDSVLVSKPPCSKCMEVLDDGDVVYKHVPGSNVNPKNWKAPDDIDVKVGSSFDYERDFCRVQSLRVPEMVFERGRIRSELGLRVGVAEVREKGRFHRSRRYFGGDGEGDRLESSFGDGVFCGQGGNVRRRQRRSSC